MAVRGWRARSRLVLCLVGLICAWCLRWVAARHLSAPRGPRTIITSQPVVLSSPEGGAGVEAPALRKKVERANVVICVLDAARADHIGCYGYPRETTPNMDKLAAESLLFERHFADYPQTKTSTASLFTSRHADTHLATEMSELADDSFLIQRGFARAGFETVYLSASAWASPDWGFADGFDTIYSFGAVGASQGPKGRQGAPLVQRLSRKPDDLLAAFRGWLDQHPQKPFFAYLHFLPPHYPYTAPDQMKPLFAGKRPPNYQRGGLPFRGIKNVGGPAEHQRLGPGVVNDYDANLRYADWAVGQLLKELRDRGMLEKTLLIITSDHGETLGEHGYKWHPACPFEEALHIPLLIRFPGGSPAGRVSALTQTIDLLPTVYDLLRLPIPSTLVEGRSIVPLVTGGKTAVHRYLFSRTGGTPPCYVVRDLRYSLLLYKGGEMRALYDLDADPWQRRNVIGAEPEVAERMVEAFREFALAQRNPPLEFIDQNAKPRARREVDAEKVSPDLRRELKALGYLK